jgi:uncharacterized protein YceH (UPF0502 family)
MSEAGDSPIAKTWVPLEPSERRVLGVLIEKQKTTPEYYPMSVAGIVTACNQKSNRDPVTQYETEDVEEILQSLRAKGVAVMVEGSGRVTKWKHTAYDWLALKNLPVDMAVLAELLLRGPQTEGELRARASRMDDIPDLPALQAVLARLSERGLVLYLTPPGQKRGVTLSHALYPQAELERIRVSAGQRSHDAPGDPSGGSPTARPVWTTEVEALRAELTLLRGRMDDLASELERLKSALGD